MGSNYKGMRWLKCDLQMQTPADSTNWDNSNKYDMNSDADKKRAAKEFVDACIIEKLDVIAITDHNFQSKDFIKLLQSEIKTRNLEITLFPGFEFEANIGKGCHVLCIFDPNSDLEKLDHLLTNCGVSFPRKNQAGILKKSSEDLKSIIDKVQNNKEIPGIVILPHLMSDDGLFDNGNISEWMQQDCFINDDLLAVEIPKPVNQMNENFQNLFSSNRKCNPDWKRIRPIATIMSSDNKMLNKKDATGKPLKNSIGSRFSWIKMSNPSIESLRQAFLDHESRVILPNDVCNSPNPESCISQSKIVSIEFTNVAFLKDQNIFFSPNLNCIIGGRGSGKSTIIEYLRILFKKDGNINIDDGTKSRIERIKKTLYNSDSEVKVVWKDSFNIENIILWKNGDINVTSRDLEDSDTYFKNIPFKFYSQQELNKITDSNSENNENRQAHRLLELIDGFLYEKIKIFEEKESKLKKEFKDSLFKHSNLIELKKSVKILDQEIQDLKIKLSSQKEIQNAYQDYQLLNVELKYLNSIIDNPCNQINNIIRTLEDIVTSHDSIKIKEIPHKIWLDNFQNMVKQEKINLLKNIQTLVNEYYNKISNFNLLNLKLTDIKENINSASTIFSDKCSQLGIEQESIGKFNDINSAKVMKEKERDELMNKIQNLEVNLIYPDKIISELHSIWRDIHSCRKIIENQTNKCSLESIKLSVNYQQDYFCFSKIWDDFSPRGNTRLGRNWKECGKILYDFFIKEEKYDSIWEVVNSSINDTEKDVGNIFKDYSKDLYSHIKTNFEKWQNLRISRVDDSVEMELYRADKTSAGSIGTGTLSDGQRNTACLALLLTQKETPLIIDQPEDELDSNFLFKELIPLLRQTKSKRQIILSTHNANLPVNGDADLVCALHANEGKGELLSIGGLDQKQITNAVLDIMEGSEEAFRKRREKYNF